MVFVRKIELFTMRVFLGKPRQIIIFWIEANKF